MTGINPQAVDRDKGIPVLRFVDDVEVVFDDDAKTIHFRSASRTGYGDLGVNRARMEQVRALVGEKL
jgi:uncharacterized protein (DUF1499 family)